MGYAQAAIVALTLAFAGVAHAQEGRWQTVPRAGGTPVLRYQSTATLLGKPAPVTVEFFSDPHSDAASKGVTGFDIFIDGVKSLAPFGFEDFEGPDAAALKRKPMRAIVTGAGTPAATYLLSPSGWYAESDRFGFGVAAVTSKASDARAILNALARGAQLSITITDLRDSRLKLQIEIPAQSQQAAFKALVTSVRVQ